MHLCIFTSKHTQLHLFTCVCTGGSACMLGTCVTLRKQLVLSSFPVGSRDWIVVSVFAEYTRTCWALPVLPPCSSTAITTLVEQKFVLSSLAVHLWLLPSISLWYGKLSETECRNAGFQWSCLSSMANLGFPCCANPRKRVRSREDSDLARTLHSTLFMTVKANRKSRPASPDSSGERDYLCMSMLA